MLSINEGLREENIFADQFFLSLWRMLAKYVAAKQLKLKINEKYWIKSNLPLYIQLWSNELHSNKYSAYKV